MKLRCRRPNRVATSNASYQRLITAFNTCFNYIYACSTLKSTSIKCQTVDNSFRSLSTDSKLHSCETLRVRLIRQMIKLSPTDLDFKYAITRHKLFHTFLNVCGQIDISLAIASILYMFDRCHSPIPPFYRGGGDPWEKNEVQMDELCSKCNLRAQEEK